MSTLCIPLNYRVHYSAEHSTGTPLNEAHHSILFEQLQKHSARWRDIGVHLGFLASELDNIQARPFLISSAPQSWPSTMLSEWLRWAPGDSRGSTNFASLEDLKHALSESGLAGVAHDLSIIWHWFAVMFWVNDNYCTCHNHELLLEY